MGGERLSIDRGVGAAAHENSGYIRGHPMASMLPMEVAQALSLRVLSKLCSFTGPLVNNPGPCSLASGVNYRKCLSADTAFPAPLLDAFSAYRYLTVTLGFSASSIAFFGELLAHISSWPCLISIRSWFAAARLPCSVFTVGRPSLVLPFVRSEQVLGCPHLDSAQNRRSLAGETLHAGSARSPLFVSLKRYTGGLALPPIKWRPRDHPGGRS